jgi:stage II sporulation protein P
MLLALNIIYRVYKGRGVSMIHLKAGKIPDFKKWLIIIALMALIPFAISKIHLNANISKLAEYESKNLMQDNVCRLIMDKAIPMLDISMEDDDGTGIEHGNIASSILKYFTRVDLENPRSYLSSQIPLLGLIEVNTFNVKPGSLSSRDPDTPSVTPTPTPVASQNFNDTPVANTSVDANNPVVIIYHTHTRESFTPTAQYTYNMGDEDHRTSDNNFNICRVGEEIKKYLETYYGIAVAQDTTVHDLPYLKSYTRSKPTAEKLLKKYPNAGFVLDVHRDANVKRDDMVINIRGDQAAKIMFVIGKGNPHWQENYALASKLKQKVDQLYPGLVRKILVEDRITYNQDLSNKSMIIEIGADCNTLEEVLVSAKMVAKSIGDIVKGK